MKYLAALRPHQWYKNLMLFLAAIFSGNILNLSALGCSFIGFISFCALSSATYVINDWADKDRDKKHPEKRFRPIASGKIGLLGVLALVIILVSIGFSASFLLPVNFVFAGLAYFTLSQLYTVWLKHEPFADILTIAVNFVIRAVAGAFAINVYVSPWLVGGVFFFALFLLLGKRRGELMLLKKEAFFQRPSLKAYTPDVISRLSALATAALVISYSLFAFFGEHHGLFLTLPVVLYAIFYYESCVSAGSIVARKPHLAFKNPKLLFSMIIWLVLTVLILY